MAVRDFEVLEHPADIGFRGFGDTLPELFVQAALAMLSIAGDPAAVQPRDKYGLRVSSSDREALLVDWLNEVRRQADRVSGFPRDGVRGHRD